MDIGLVFVIYTFACVVLGRLVEREFGDKSQGQPGPPGPPGPAGVSGPPGRCRCDE